MSLTIEAPPREKKDLSPAQLKEEILRLTREFSRKSHVANPVQADREIALQGIVRTGRHELTDNSQALFVDLERLGLVTCGKPHVANSVETDEEIALPRRQRDADHNGSERRHQRA